MTIVLGILGLSFLVFFHELGHFLVARAVGVKVEAFSIGMGPVLLHKTIGQTDYRISLIPLGGYCAMKGENDYRTALEAGLSEIHGDKDSFYGTHPFKRILIAFAGPFFNLIFAFIAFFVIATIGYTYKSAGTTVKMTDETEEYADLPSPAHDAGMKSGDKIISMNGQPMGDFSDIAAFTATHGGEVISVTVERDGKTLEIKVQTELDKSTGIGRLGIVSDKNSVTERHYGPYGFFPAIVEGGRQTFSMLGMTLRGIATLFKGVDITNAVSGPARITQILGSTVQDGFKEGVKIGIISTLQLLAMISLSLFLTNLLPVPVLDGGLILFALIELVARKKMHPKVLYYIQFVGIALIVGLLVLAIIGDIRYFIR